MKESEIVVGEVKSTDLRAKLRTLLNLKVPHIVHRNSRPVAVLLPLKTQWYYRLEHTSEDIKHLYALLDAVVAKLLR